MSKLRNQIQLKREQHIKTAFTIAPTQESLFRASVHDTATSHLSQTRASLRSSNSGGLHNSNTHVVHRDEEYHRPESRAFLKDPQWKRSDFHASLDRFRELKPSIETKLYQMHEQAVDA